MSRSLHKSSIAWLALLALGASLVLLAVLAGIYSLANRPAPDPLAAYRPALNPRLADDSARLAAAATYSITVQINPTQRVYTGTVEVRFPVTVTTPLNEIYFRLYPNLPQFNGQLQVTSASVNGKTVNYGFAADGSAAHLVLPQPLAVGQAAQVNLSFAGAPPEHKAGVYTLVGASEDVLSLGTFYPVLAPRRPDGSWVLDLAHPQGDAGFQEAGLYQAAVTTAPEMVVVTTGTEVGQTPAAGGWVTRHYVQGPGREFALLLSPRYQALTEEAYGTRVHSYFFPEDAEAGKSALYTALAALQIYSDEFGPYPYRDMSVVEAPLTFKGQEFPGMSLIGNQVYSKYQDDLEKLVSHEVAHQWWYNQVGSDQIRAPWLDEGLAEFSMYLYYARRHGIPEADLLQLRRWEAPAAAARQNGTDAPIDRPVEAYNQRNYETVIYAKGALFFAALREEIGAAAFQQLLRTYLEQYRWQIATPADFRAVAERVSKKDLGALFDRWMSAPSG